MRTVGRFLVLAAVAAAATSCGDVVRNSRAPVLVIVDSLQGAQGNHASTLSGVLTSDVITNVTTPAPCTTTDPCPTVFNDIGQATMHLTLKDIGVAGFNLNPSDNNQVTITRYHVVYTRADGRNTPGVDVPFAFDGAVTSTVPTSGQATFSFEIVRHDAKLEAPLVNLRSSPTIITTIANITFFGTDAVGNEVSATGSITIEFGNFGDS